MEKSRTIDFVDEILWIPWNSEKYKKKKRSWFIERLNSLLFKNSTRETRIFLPWTFQFSSLFLLWEFCHISVISRITGTRVLWLLNTSTTFKYGWVAPVCAFARVNVLKKKERMSGTRWMFERISTGESACLLKFIANRSKNDLNNNRILKLNKRA